MLIEYHQKTKVLDLSLRDDEGRIALDHCNNAFSSITKTLRRAMQLQSVNGPFKRVQPKIDALLKHRVLGRKFIPKQIYARQRKCSEYTYRP